MKARRQTELLEKTKEQISKMQATTWEMVMEHMAVMSERIDALEAAERERQAALGRD